MVVLTLFRVTCGLSMALCLVPLNWHWRARNVPAIALILWLVPYNLCTWVNSFIWPTDESLYTGWEGGIYCDVQIKIIMAGYTGIIMSILAIARNLANILSDDNPVMRTKAVQRRENIKDLIICLGIPLFMMAIHYVVQTRRYYLYTISGCGVVVDRSWPSIAIIFIWPPITALIASYYAAMVIFRLHKYRTRFSSILSNSTYATKSRFMRLFILAIVVLLIFLPASIYMFLVNVSQEFLPYSWSEVHGDGWLSIKKMPTGNRINFDRWPPVGVGILVFLLFGLGKDAMTLYRDWLNRVGIGKYLPDRFMARERPGVRAFAPPATGQGSVESKTRADPTLTFSSSDWEDHM